MNFKIPFTVISIPRLIKSSENYRKLIRRRENTRLARLLLSADVPVSREEYLSICYRTFVRLFVTLLVLSLGGLFFIGVPRFVLYSLGLSLLLSLFVLFSQLVYPKVYNNRKQRRIEKNLIAALEDILIQLNSGIPLFTILVNISAGDYDQLSEEFKKAVRKINSGIPQVEVLEELGERNPSLYFRRTLWQISNGMRAGSDISIVVEDSIKALNEEQLIQIQNYGNKLNPMIMFYMLISVIMPALAVTFLMVLASLVNLPSTIVQFMFIGLFFFVMIVQVMFLGVIKSIRRSLL